jgi:hypothetical protein
MIFVTCECGQRIKNEDRDSGRVITCPSCRRPLEVKGEPTQVVPPGDFVTPWRRVTGAKRSPAPPHSVVTPHTKRGQDAGS